MRHVRLNAASVLCVAGLSLWAPLPVMQAEAAEQPKKAQAQAQAQDPSQKTVALPGGASALNETFQDWQVTCASPQGTKRCAVSQQQTDSKTQQRVLAVELQPHGEAAEGMLILPFGLDLDKGITLKAGETQIGSTLRFKTCLPQGCIAALSFDQKTLELLHKAPSVTVSVSSGDTGQVLSLQVSLKGFAPALNRAAALAE